ncbi:MAG: helix-turn-helix domain-containing protein [Armatimonadota bacterium]
MNEGLSRETYSVPEAAKVIGIGENSLYDAIREKRIPHLRFGRKIVIPKAALQHFLEMPDFRGILETQP